MHQRCGQAIMNIVDLTNKEDELCSIVHEVHGTMADKNEQLRDQGVFDDYRQVHTGYADRADKDLESLKRGLFIQWYAFAEPSCFTGINELEKDAELKIIELTDNLITADKMDLELNWMLSYYSTWDSVFDRFRDYKALQEWIQNKIGTELPDTIDRQEMATRGQMGKYWNSLNHFVK